MWGVYMWLNFENKGPLRNSQKKAEDRAPELDEEELDDARLVHMDDPRFLDMAQSWTLSRRASVKWPASSHNKNDGKMTDMREGAFIIIINQELGLALYDKRCCVLSPM